VTAVKIENQDQQGRAAFIELARRFQYVYILNSIFTEANKNVGCT
jgi:hypothetical protein